MLNIWLNLDKEKPVLATGDYNVAHKEIDLANPASNRRSPGFTDEEREGFTNLLAKGFTDTFRHLHGDVPGALHLVGATQQDFKNQQHRLENRLLVNFKPHCR